jgi:hypothetical protein
MLTPSAFSAMSDNPGFCRVASQARAGLAYNFLVPYLMGALATLDDRGRWAVAEDSLWNGGAVPGPWVAGVLVEKGGMLSLAGWALVTGGICLALIAGALRRFESRRTGATSP